MHCLVRVAAIAAAAFVFAPLSAEDAKVEQKGKHLNTIISASCDHDKEKKVLTINAVGQVNTGGWSNAKLTPRKTNAAPKDGIYEFDMTAVPPDGPALQVISKIKAEYKWENPPADIKGVKIYGEGEGAKTVMLDK